MCVCVRTVINKCELLKENTVKIKALWQLLMCWYTQMSAHELYLCNETFLWNNFHNKKISEFCMTPLFLSRSVVCVTDYFHYVNKFNTQHWKGFYERFYIHSEREINCRMIIIFKPDSETTTKRPVNAKITGLG